MELIPETCGVLAKLDTYILLHKWIEHQFIFCYRFHKRLM